MEHTCAIDIVGYVWCWGWDEFGQLGNGTSDLNQHPNPLKIKSLTNIVEISAGYSHTCAINTTGSIWCWGGNTNGQLGIGNTTDAYFPKLVPGILSMRSRPTPTNHPTLTPPTTSSNLSTAMILVIILSICLVIFSIVVIIWFIKCYQSNEVTVNRMHLYENTKTNKSSLEISRSNEPINFKNDKIQKFNQPLIKKAVK